MNYPIEWLLEPENPSVRYLTLKHLLDKPEDNIDVRNSKNEIMEKGIVPRILAKQINNGCWGKPEDFYIKSKYRGTIWSFLILTEMGADKNDKRIKGTCEFLLNRAQHTRSGAFAYRSHPRGDIDPPKTLPCLTGNVLWGLIRFGYLEDRRIQKGINWITKYLRFDDGKSQPPKIWPYSFDKCWGKHTCHMGIVKCLKALAEIPSKKRSPAARETINHGSEYLLKHHIFRRSHDISQIGIPDWLEFGFPLMWNSDILEVILILQKLGVGDSRMRESLEIIHSKQDGNGKWLLEKTYNGRFLTRIEQKGKPSKWITLRAMMVIKNNRNNQQFI